MSPWIKASLALLSVAALGVVSALVAVAIGAAVTGDAPLTPLENELFGIGFALTALAIFAAAICFVVDQLRDAAADRKPR